MFRLPSILFLCCFIGFVGSLKCYLGYSIMKGSTVGTETKECEKRNRLFTLQKAGCNTVICQFNPNKCFEQSYQGQKVTFCCCNTEDLCNGGAITESGSLVDRGLSVLKGLVGVGKKK
ncbi:unnamed protein product [Caenorhabditis angaria]|uniref:UPAR/Ly6 domain-containing protein n=1 Tax=Caenorhabditis angaria TaxID=860376 RepID=A0A9P1I362_9PELO|nr:unnamed protein product [Caenorhabditis angaria]